MTEQTLYPVKNRYPWALRKLFSHPSMVLIGGVWKSEKTDFAFKISEDLLKLDVINECATNVETFGHYPLISDLVSLRQWLYKDNKRKLYIFDEASEHLDSRRAMSGMNVGFANLIPQISKAHARLTVVGHQLLRVDKTLLDDTYCRGLFIKVNLKKAKLISHLMIRPYVFLNVPSTSVHFDPYAIAPFTEKPAGTIYFKEEDKQVLWDWSNGKTCKDLNIHSMTLNRMVRKYVRNSLENEHHTSPTV